MWQTGVCRSYPLWTFIETSLRNAEFTFAIYYNHIDSLKRIYRPASLFHLDEDQNRWWLYYPFCFTLL